MRNLWKALISQDRAVANARAAATAASSRRVEREDVALFFERPEAAPGATPTEPREGVRR